MPRIEYKCTCDKCGIVIASPNDENDVSFNSDRYVYCDTCYQDFYACVEHWKAGYKMKAVKNEN